MLVAEDFIETWYRVYVTTLATMIIIVARVWLFRKHHYRALQNVAIEI